MTDVRVAINGLAIDGRLAFRQMFVARRLQKLMPIND